MPWIEHLGTLYNLEKYTQIQRGNDDEILLSAEIHNLNWDNEKNYAVLIFETQSDRDDAFYKITEKLRRA